LKHCASYSEEVHNIDHGLIESNDIIRSISRRSFTSCPLPSHFRKKLTSASDEVATPKKRKTDIEKDNKDGRGNKVQNANIPLLLCMEVGEVYHDVFATKHLHL